MILEQNFDAGDEIIKGTLHGESNPYAMNEAINRNDQYMFGPSIMVAPFYDDFSEQREVTLPPENWYDFYDGTYVGNGTKIIVTAASLNNKIPLFVKEGAAIPMLTKPVMNTGEVRGHPLEIRLYGNCESQFELYEDDGSSFDYLDGKYRIRSITVSKTKNGYTYGETITKNDANALFGKIEKMTIMGDQ